MVSKMEESVELYNTKLAVIRHQQGLCYEEYMKDKKVRWDDGDG